MRFCEKKPTKMEAITNGYELGVKECKYQFRKRRWNCTSLGSKHTFSSHAVRKYSVLIDKFSEGISLSVVQPYSSTLTSSTDPQQVVQGLVYYLFTQGIAILLEYM